MKLVLYSFAVFVTILILIGCADSQQLTQEQASQEFIREFPSQKKSEIVRKELQWIAENTDAYESTKTVVGPKGDGVDSIISDGTMDLWIGKTAVILKVKFTMTAKVKDYRMRVRFTNLRRWFGSKSFDNRVYDPFFSTTTGLPYQRKAQTDFNAIVERMTSFITFGD